METVAAKGLSPYPARNGFDGSWTPMDRKSNAEESEIHFTKHDAVLAYKILENECPFLGDKISNDVLLAWKLAEGSSGNAQVDVSHPSGRLR